MGKAVPEILIHAEDRRAGPVAVGANSAIPVDARERLRALVLVLRPHQWIKNLLVLAPLVFAGELRNMGSVLAALRAFALFVLASGLVYVFNDILDRESDRRHPGKRKRPIAARALSVPAALVELSSLTLLLAVLLFWEAPSVVALFAGYLALNVAYSLCLQRIPIVDVTVVAAGFVIRALVGGEVIGVTVTAWLAACTLTLCLFVGFGKRWSELCPGGARIHGKAIYSEHRLKWLMALSMVACGTLYLLYALFSETAARATGGSLLLTVPFAFFCLARYWRGVTRGQIGEITDVFFRDPAFSVSFVGWVLAVVVVLYAGG